MSNSATFARIMKIALPIAAANAMVPLVGLVDTAVIGRLGEVAPLAAVGIGAALLSSLFWLFNFLDITTTAHVGRARGAGDPAAVAQHLVKALTLTIWLLPLASLLGLIVYFAFAKIYGISDQTSPYLQTYLGIRLWSLPLVLLGHVFAGYLLAHERTRAIFAIETLRQGTNLLLDIVCVAGLSLGVAGVALASVIADVSGFILAVYILREPLRDAVRTIMSQRLEWLERSYIQNSGYVFLRAVCLNLTILTFHYFSNGLGDNSVAINAVLMIFITFAAQATDGFAVAIEVLTAQAIGQNNLSSLRNNIVKGSLLSLLAAILIAALIFMFGDEIFAMISTHEELQNEARHYFLWIILAIMLGIVTWSLDGVYFGANLGFEMFISGALALILFVLAAFILSDAYANTGLWIAMASSYLFRTLGLAMFYPRVEALAR